MSMSHTLSNQNLSVFCAIHELPAIKKKIIYKIANIANIGGNSKTILIKVTKTLFSIRSWVMGEVGPDKITWLIPREVNIMDFNKTFP